MRQVLNAAYEVVWVDDEGNEVAPPPYAPKAVAETEAQRALRELAELPPEPEEVVETPIPAHLWAKEVALVAGARQRLEASLEGARVAQSAQKSEPVVLGAHPMLYLAAILLSMAGTVIFFLLMDWIAA